MDERLQIIIDTREQNCWGFPEHLAVCTRQKLDTGDYALAGDDGFAIERKSFNDFCGTISTGYVRFRKEVERMANWHSRVVLVECSFADLLNGNPNHPQLTPQFLCKRVAELTMMGVSVLFAGDAACASAMAYKILKERRAMLDEIGSQSGEGSVS